MSRWTTTKPRLSLKADAKTQRLHLISRAYTLKSELSVVFSALNDLTTSSSLPPELLSCIFLHYTQSTTPSNHIKRLLAIAHVCRRWREAALGCQLLWTQVFVPCQSDLLQVIAQRFGNCSLDVTLLSEDELYEDTSTTSDDPMKSSLWQPRWRASPMSCARSTESADSQ